MFAWVQFPGAAWCWFRWWCYVMINVSCSYPNVTLSRTELYASEPYDRARELVKVRSQFTEKSLTGCEPAGLWILLVSYVGSRFRMSWWWSIKWTFWMCLMQKEAALSRSKLRDGPFKLNLHPRDYFQDNPFHSNKPLPPAPRLLSPSQKVSPPPFKPSSPSKRVTLSSLLSSTETLWRLLNAPLCVFVLDWRNESRNFWHLSFTFCWSIHRSPIQTEPRARLPPSSGAKEHTGQEHHHSQRQQVSLIHWQHRESERKSLKPVGSLKQAERFIV